MCERLRSKGVEAEGRISSVSYSDLYPLQSCIKLLQDGLMGGISAWLRSVSCVCACAHSSRWQQESEPGTVRTREPKVETVWVHVHKR